MMLVLNEDFSVGRRIATLIFRSGAWTRKERRAPAADRRDSGRRARAATALWAAAGTRAQTTESATSAAICAGKNDGTAYDADSDRAGGGGPSAPERC